MNHQYKDIKERSQAATDRSVRDVWYLILFSFLRHEISNTNDQLYKLSKNTNNERPLTTLVEAEDNASNTVIV